MGSSVRVRRSQLAIVLMQLLFGAFWFRGHTAEAAEEQEEEMVVGRKHTV